MVKRVLVTGANAGLGKDCARQLAMNSATERVYLGCRNPTKAQAAKAELEAVTGREVFDILIIDVMDLDSVRAAVEALPEPVDGVVLNAGGPGPGQPGDMTKNGATNAFAVNVLGHSLLVDELIAANKLTGVAVYAGSEAARGVKVMRMPPPSLNSGSVEEFVSVIDGSYFPETNDPMVAYGTIKLTAALWMSSMSRKHPGIRFVTMSPGGTTGTNIVEEMSGVQRLFMKYVMMPAMNLFGVMHALDVGAKRYVDALQDEAYETGHFYASARGMTGEVIDQRTLLADVANTDFQDNANEAIHRFL